MATIKDAELVLSYMQKSQYFDGVEIVHLPKYISKDLNISRYKVNNAIKLLKEENKIKYVCWGGGVDDFGYPHPPLNGYKLNNYKEQNNGNN